MLNRFIETVKNTVKGGGFMMVMLFAINIAKDNFKFSRVPKALKNAVKEQLELIVLDEQELARLLAK